MILLTDVGYDDVKGTALAAGVLIESWDQEEPIREVSLTLHGIAPYEPGSFYKRELPCLHALIEKCNEPLLRYILVDGYVDLEPGHPGLGYHLYESLPLEGWGNGRCSVVGVAKTRFRGAVATEVFRGISENPLYVTARGLSQGTAADFVRAMHGNNRIPTLLKRVDALSRGR